MTAKVINFALHSLISAQLDQLCFNKRSKTLPPPSLSTDLWPCQVDIFSEVRILERLAGQPGYCQLYDYGVDGDSFVLVQKDYRTSLRNWRIRQPADPCVHEKLYVEIFWQIMEAIEVSPLTFL